MREEKNGYHALSLNEARSLTPPVNPVEAMRRQLALALFDAVKPDDVLTLASKLRDMAMAGDLKAMTMFFKLVLPKDEPAPAPQDGAGLKAMAEAVRDLVDEVRIARAHQDKAAGRLVLPEIEEED